MQNQPVEKVLFVLEDTDESDVIDIKTLIEFHYPGLLTKGYVPWQLLRESKTWSGGMSFGDAEIIIEKFNAGMGNIDATRMITKDLDEWPTYNEFHKVGDLFNSVTRQSGETATTEPKPKKELPVEPKNGRQLIYGIWAFVDDFDFNDKKYIKSPWIGGRKGTDIPVFDTNLTWSTSLNLATTAYAMRYAKCDYPIRFLLPKGWEEKMVDSLYEDGYNDTHRLVAVLLIRYTATYDDRSRYNMRPYSGVKEDTIPLFVYKSGRDGWNTYMKGTENDPAAGEEAYKYVKLYESFKLFNYKGRSVEWGEFRNKKRYSYYELRDIMSHLCYRGEDVEQWKMFRIDATEHDPNVQYLIRKRKGVEEDEIEMINKDKDSGLTPVGIDWNRDVKPTSLKITDLESLKAPKLDTTHPHGAFIAYDDWETDYDNISLEERDKKWMTHFSDTVLDRSRPDIRDTPDDTYVEEVPLSSGFDTYVNLGDKSNLENIFGMYANQIDDIKEAIEFWNKKGAKPNPLNLLVDIRLPPPEDEYGYVSDDGSGYYSEGGARPGGGRLVTALWAAAVLLLSALAPYRPLALQPRRD